MRKINIGSVLLGLLVFFIIPIVVAGVILFVVPALKQNVGSDSFKFTVYEFLLAFPLGIVLSLVTRRFFIAALHWFLFVGWSGYAAETGLRISNDPTKNAFTLKAPALSDAFHTFVNYNISFDNFVRWPFLALLLIICIISISSINNGKSSPPRHDFDQHPAQKKRRRWSFRRKGSRNHFNNQDTSSSPSPARPSHTSKRSATREYGIIVILLLAGLFGYFAGATSLPSLRHIVGWDGVLMVYSYIGWAGSILATIYLSIAGIIETLAWKWSKE